MITKFVLEAVVAVAFVLIIAVIMFLKIRNSSYEKDYVVEWENVNQPTKVLYQPVIDGGEYREFKNQIGSKSWKYEDSEKLTEYHKPSLYHSAHAAARASQKKQETLYTER